MKKIIYLLLCLLPVLAFSQESTGGIQIQTNFGVNIASPIDSRTVLENVSDTANIEYKYPSLKVYCLDIARYFTFNGSAWIQETANGSALPNNISDTSLIDQKVLGNVIYDSVNNISYIWNGSEWITVNQFTENAFPLTTLADTSIFQAPATGQVVYDMSTGQYWFYNGSNWTYLNYVQDSTTIATLADTTTIISPILGNAVFVTATGEYWIFNGTNWEILGQFIQGATPLPSIADTSLLAAPVVGQAIYDQSTMQFYIWNGTNWELVNLDNPQSEGFSVPFFIIPGSFITTSGGDAAAPSDSIINNIGSLLYNSGAITAGAYLGTSGSVASSNPMYAGFSPFNVWQWTGSKAYKISGKPVSISLTDTLWGGSAVRPLDTVIYSGAYPTAAQVATWYQSNYNNNGLFLENGSIVYFIGNGSKEAPEKIYVVTGSDLTRNGLSQQLIKEMPVGTWLKPSIELSDVEIITENKLSFADNHRLSIRNDSIVISGVDTSLIAGIDSTYTIPTGSIANGSGGALLNAPISIFVSGDYAYVCARDDNALEIINISDPQNPVHEGSIVNGSGGALLSTPQDVVVVGNYAYVVSSNSDALQIIDISTPSAPTAVGNIVNGSGGAMIDGPQGVWVSGNYAYIATTLGDDFEIVDISVPSAPVHVGSLSNGSGGALLDAPTDVQVVGNYAYVASNVSNAIEIIDISTPSAPVHAASLVNGSGGALLSGAAYLQIAGNYAYVMAHNSFAIQFIDISNPLAPLNAGNIAYTSSYRPRTMYLDEYTGMAAVSFTNFSNVQDIVLMDFSNLSDIKEVSSIRNGQGITYNFPSKIFFDGFYAYALGLSSDNLNILQYEKSNVLDANGYISTEKAVINSPYIPIDSNDPLGKVGEIGWDSDYIYIKTNSGWKRATLSTF